MGEREDPKMTRRVVMLHGAVIKGTGAGRTEFHGLSPVCSGLYKLGTLYL